MIPRRILALGLAGLAGCASARAADATADRIALRRLNDAYLQAFLESDAGRFRAILAEDFSAVLANGRRIDRSEFLREAALPSRLRDFRVRDVAIQVYGDAATVSDLVSYLLPGGAPGRTRYTELCARLGGGWRIVSVQIVRVSAP